SLPTVHGWLQRLLPGRAPPSVAKLGRWTQETAARVSTLLPVLDEFARAWVKQVAGTNPAVPRPGPFLKTQCEGTPDSLRPPARHGDSLDGRQLRHPHRLRTLARRPNACRWLCPCCRTLRSDQDALGQERRFRRVLGRRLKPTPRRLMTPWPLPEARWRTSVPR